MVEDAPRTRGSLAEDIRGLGVTAGDTLLVHSSLRALGWVCGGAQAVVQALLDAVGPEGTLVVPTQTSENSEPSRWAHPPVPAHWWPIIRAEMPAFDPALTPSRGMGAIAEQVRTWPGALRSTHPQTSFAAVGARADAIVADHPLGCALGDDSPLGRLEDGDASVLLLGVGYDSCTAFHLAEYRQDAPPIEAHGAAILDQAGRRDWVQWSDVALDEDDFERIGEAFDAAGPVRPGSVGAAHARVFPVRDAVSFATEWIAHHRHGGS